MIRLLACYTAVLGLACGSTAKDTQTDDAGVLECEGPNDCGLGEICVSNTCVPAACDDGDLSGNESDVDCGGDCLPCGEGQTCNGESDCSSRYCDGFSRCRDCENNDQCAGADGTYCLGGLCVDQLDNGSDCAEGYECSSGVCASEGVCCDIECSTSCSTGTCEGLRANGVSCTEANQCVSNVCAWDGVCCNTTCDGECESGTCQPIESFTNKSAGNCTTNLANNISYDADIQVCVKGLRPDGTGQALGWSAVGNVSCPSSGYTLNDTNDDWTYDAANNVWTSPMDWIPAPDPSYNFTPNCPAGQLCFTTCWKNKDASGAVFRVYTIVE